MTLQQIRNFVDPVGGDAGMAVAIRGRRFKLLPMPASASGQERLCLHVGAVFGPTTAFTATSVDFTVS